MALSNPAKSAPVWESPLQEVERNVQQRAKTSGLDVTSSSGPSQLRRLITEELESWSSAYKRGMRRTPIADPDGVADRAYRNLAGYGPLEPLLADDDVWEICLNAPDAIFVKRHSGDDGYFSEVFHDDAHVVRTLTKILDEASGSHRKFDPSTGLQDAQLHNGARLHIVHSDVGRDGHTLFNIRKFTGVPIRSLRELVRREMLTATAADFLRACIKARRSVVFSGPPGSGKTTLLSCCAAELDPSLRVVIAEEVFEADVPLPNVAQMQTRPPRSDRPEVDLRRLVAGFLRMAPDVAIVGEVRDREALPLLLTLSSGVTGYTTIHAASARAALTRLRFVAQLADTSTELPLAALNHLVSESIDVVVHCTRNDGRIAVDEIITVEDLQTGNNSSAFTTTPLFVQPASGAPLSWSGNLPVRLARPLANAAYDMRRLQAQAAGGRHAR